MKMNKILETALNITHSFKLDVKKQNKKTGSWVYSSQSSHNMLCIMYAVNFKHRQNISLCVCVAASCNHTHLYTL